MQLLNNIGKYIYRNRVPVSVTIICVYAFYLRIRHLYFRELWVDEIYYLHPATRNTFFEFLQAIPRTGSGSYLSGDLLLYYPFFKIFSYNKWGLAIPSIVATVVGFYLLYRICQRYFKSIFAYLITFLIVCFNATMINHATEIRTYAILPAIALGTFYFMQKIADSEFRLKLPARIGAIALFALVIWFHVYGIFMYMSCFLFTILSRYEKRSFKALVKNGILFTCGVLCLAMPLWIYSVFGPQLYDKASIDPFYYFPNPLYDTFGFLKSVFCNLIGFKLLYFVLLGTFIPFFFSYKERTKQLMFFLLIVAAPIGLILLSNIIRHFWFLQRQFIWVMPFFAFYLGWVWDSFIILVNGAGRLKRRLV